MTLRYIIVDDSLSVAQDAADSALTEDSTTVTNSKAYAGTDADLSGDLTVDGAVTVTGDVASSGDVSGVAGTFSGAVEGTTGTFSGAISGTDGTFTGNLSSAGSLVSGVSTVETETYDIADDDYNVLVSYTSTGAQTTTIPTAQLAAGRELFIKDIDGNAGTNSLTVATEGTETIEGGNAVVINTDYGDVCLISDGSNWFIKS